MNFADMLRGSMEDSTSNDRPLATAEYATEIGNRYLQKHDFKIGDLVQWKPGLKSAKFPAYDEPCMVVDKMPGQRTDTGTGGNNHDGEPVDIRVLVRLPDREDGAHVCGYWFDSNRFEPYKG